MPKLVATHEGRTFHRFTDREYTHVVIAKKAGDEEHAAFEWCGRLDIAEANADKARGAGFLDVHILEVQTEGASE